MTNFTANYPFPADTSATAHLRNTVHKLGTLAYIALLTFAAELALETLPTDPKRNQGLQALRLVGQFAAGERVNPGDIVSAMHNEHDEGIMPNQQAAPSGPQADAWATAVGVMGYAAYQGYMRSGEHPDGLVEGWRSPDALDFCIDPFITLSDLDCGALARAEAYALDNGSDIAAGWGKPLWVEAIRKAASPAVDTPA